jgi:hypothetical protein
MLMVALVAPLARGADAPPPGRYAQQLAAECDALMSAAVKRPYGWGWDTVAPAGSARAGAAPRHVAMEPLGTPAAGLLLLWSGELLNEPKYQQAAIEAAKGIAAAQNASGQVPLHAMFASSAGGRDEPQTVPDRTATRAAVALLVSILHDDPKAPEQLSRSAQRAVQWLIRQQTEDGGWPSGYVLKTPEEERPQNLRIIRMNTPDVRDTTFAMLLAADTLDDRLVTQAATRSVLKIINLRLGATPQAPSTQPATGDLPPSTQQAPFSPLAAILSDEPDADRRTNNLWSTVYRLSGAVDPALSEFPASADVPASRYAIQALLGAYLMNGDRQTGVALDSAVQSAGQLREPDGTWKSRYLRQPSTAPTTDESEGIFGPRKTVPTGSTALEPTLNAVQQLKLLRRDRYIEMLDEQFTVRQHLAATVCGLTDNPLTLDLPVTKSEVQTYVKEHDADWRMLEGQIPPSLQQRLTRLWMLLIRAKLEQKLQ